MRYWLGEQGAYFGLLPTIARVLRQATIPTSCTNKEDRSNHLRVMSTCSRQDLVVLVGMQDKQSTICLRLQNHVGSCWILGQLVILVITMSLVLGLKVSVLLYVHTALMAL
ncbi:hypothetical protein RRG08_024345 [Elysia crispata]|uniref:Uncharacterized protein n=1 Tax=Elysia crispata TaxID=231223 RepID=A0AAE0ZM23_9GAST|nr:hypothetical protein RRG08_024345 [Elysia crispata]